MDAANGVGGKLAPLVFEGTPLDCVEMYFEVDGTFPNHEPNPLLEENSREIRERVVAEKADLGIAWDGDADRCFFIDEDGEFVPGDFVTALLAEALLLKNPGAKILYDLRASRAVPDVITANGGVPLLNRVGHAFFKQRMRREGGLFGGEVSGHYYFADNYNADSGFIPALLILELLSQKKATMAELLEPLRTKYFISGEINSVVDDVPAALARIEERFSDGEQGHLDGISVDYDRLALQRAPVQHRAAPASQPRRRHPGAHGGEARPRPLRHPRGLTWTTVTDLGPARAAEIDRDGMFAEVAGLPRQLREGYEAARGRLGRRVLRDVPGHPAGRAERRGRVRHGRLRDRRRPRPRLPARPQRAGDGRARVRAPRVGGPRDAGRRRELLGRDRGGARLRRAGALARLRPRMRVVRRRPRRLRGGGGPAARGRSRRQPAAGGRRLPLHAAAGHARGLRPVPRARE